MSTRILNANDARALGEIVTIASQGFKVRRLVGSDVVEATARALVLSPENPVFPGPGDDVRDCWLWVTGTSGFERYWPVMELVYEWQQMMLAVLEEQA